MTNKFKEIDLNKEFEYSDYELDLVTNSDTISLVCSFVYYPSFQNIAGRCFNWQKEAYVDLIEVKEYGKDLFDVMSERVIAKIEQQILEDLMK